MIAVGAIIELKGTDKILVIQRSKEAGIHENEWEILYGRIDQHEELTEALQREVQEETGITDLTPKQLLRIAHIYRGEKSADHEVYIFTYVCETSQEEVSISNEHLSYKWVTVDEALQLVKIEGIRRDIEIYKNDRDKLGPIIISDINREETYI